MGDEYPRHLTGAQLAAYYHSYATYFGLLDKIVFSVTVRLVERDESNGGWLLHVDGEEKPRQFDRVVLATGSESARKMPIIADLDKFKGKVMHGQEYKGYVVPALPVGLSH